MPLNPVPIIEATTDEVTTPEKFRVDTVPATVMAFGLDGSETVSIAMSDDGGATNEQVTDGGTDIVLDVNTNAKTIVSPMTIMVTKTASAAPVRVSIAFGGFA